MRTSALALAALLTVAGTASAAPLSPPVPGIRFDIAYEPARFSMHVAAAVVLWPEIRFGSGSYEWSLVAGSLPPGLVLDPLGTVSGAPGIPGRYSWTLAVRDLETGASATTTASAVVVQ